ncbi:ATP-binding protein [Cereibacter sphaeroides]|jgi:hypothetical protein|uniref:HD domain-containing protein n=1 Tax=Cereibacter sphaeroides TaxID=1063 RepID=UPI000066558C|nr:Molecular chaperone HSP90 family-like protein [Cereibacter sphaeroides ATCC 17029]
MELPKKISEALFNENALSTMVHGAIDSSKHIISAKPEFFPEYTDHGPNHNTEVLDTALGILTEDALEALSASDYAVLALSVLLHDCGMHLSSDGFVSLIDPRNELRTSADNVTWRTLWDEFILEAKRFDGRKLKSLFGTTDPISDIPDNPDDFTSKHKLLIGEFLRRHHPRLAHEIALFGFPGADGERIKICTTEHGDLPELAGLIARSHGMSMRKACDVVGERFHAREYQRVHPPILMAALRIADFLQIQPERAPKAALKLRKLSSPFSTGEWQVHQSVRNITPADDDPEAIFVDAMPKTVATFLKFRTWAEGFQRELDSTWAALGEVYGRFAAQGFDKYQLRLRRLRTSIDDAEHFAKSVPYLPSKISFEASGPDLLSLLVAPLYGNRPEIGLRELIQNSIDAVIEREHIEGQVPSGDLAGHNADVIVYPVYEGEDLVSVVVEDRGIGMDADVVQNYFLRAGASFRSSSQWKKQFTTPDGKSEVSRTGRFGVGALAGFLIGSTIAVETRRVGHATGFKFAAEIDNEAIEVTECIREIGTKITIHIDSKKNPCIEALLSNSDQQKNWDWYCGSHPRLARVDKSGEEIPAHFTAENTGEWVRVPSSDYANVRWSYRTFEAKPWSNGNAKLYSNNIYITDLTDYGDSVKVFENDISPGISLSTPTVLITDKDGRLPLNLQRNGLTERDEKLADQLKLSLTKDLILQAIALAPEVSPFEINAFEKIMTREVVAKFTSISSRNNYREKRSHWCWEDEGWRLADFSNSLQKPFILLIHDQSGLARLKDLKVDFSDVSVIWLQLGASPKNANDIQAILREQIYSGYLGRKGAFSSLNVWSSSVVHKVLQGNPTSYMKSIVNDGEEFSPGHVILRNGKLKHSVIEGFREALRNDKSEEPFVFSMVAGGNSSGGEDAGLLCSEWSDLLGGVSIPVAFEDRKSAFPGIFEEFGGRIEFIRQNFLKE